MRSPIWWFGGKGNMVKKLLGLMPPHEHYVEVFGGAASLLLAKRSTGGVEVYNDIDEGLVDFFRVLRDRDKFTEFHRLVSLTPYSRAEYNWCRDTWRGCKDEVERARRWFVVARMSFAGKFGCGWSFVVSEASGGRASAVSKYLSAVERLSAVHARLMRVQIERNDFRKIIVAYVAPDTLLYCDPPYVHRTRKSGKYAHEMSDEDHEDLVALLLEYPQMVMLSGYAHEIYSPLEGAGWVRRDFDVACYTTKEKRTRRQRRVESVWLNPKAMEKKGIQGRLL